MKKTFIKTRIITVFLILCMVLSLMPDLVLAEDFVTETADFTGSDKGKLAISLLNKAKTGEEDSTWDNESKTLTLKGINFTTLATTALKLPDGATIILSDNTTNQITGGDAVTEANGTYKNDVYIYGIYAEGQLTIKGEKDGTGTLLVNSGSHTNSGDAWTYSVALYGKGNVNIEGGTTTLKGGKASSADCAFSNGMELSEKSGLFVTGGNLIGIGNETIDTGDEKERKSFSRGIDIYKGNVSVSGNGKLTARCVPSMNGEGLAYGVYVLMGNLNVSDNAEILAVATNPIDVSGGDLKQSGGKITAKATGTYNSSLDVTRENNSGGNIEITGGILEADNGGIYMYQYQPTKTQGIFSVTGGMVKTPSIYGANQLTVSGGTVESGRITTKEFNLYSGSVIVREPVHKGEYTGTLYVSPAIWSGDITVNGGILDAAWDWGENTPIVFPEDEYTGYPDPLVRTDDNIVNFNGGTVILDTGCAGNTVIRAKTINCGSDVVKTGTKDLRIQKYDDTPVVFSDIVRKPVTVSGIGIKNKVYDATNRAEIDTANVKFSNVSGEDGICLEAEEATALFDSKNAGENKPVSVTGAFGLRGKDAYKYKLTQPTLNSLYGTITPCTNVINTTTPLQNVLKGVGTFDKPHISGMFGEPGSESEIIETDTGKITYTIKGTSITNGSYDEVVKYLKTLPLGSEVELIYSFNGNANYAGATFDDGNGGKTNTGSIKIKINEEKSQFTKVVRPGIAKVKKAIKKKSSSKIKISLKKVKKAKGYYVQISKSKKFKKVLVKKYVKKVSFTIKGKKLKNKKKLYVRAKSYVLKGKIKIYSKKWSKVKKVKIRR